MYSSTFAHHLLSGKNYGGLFYRINGATVSASALNTNPDLRDCYVRTLPTFLLYRKLLPRVRTGTYAAFDCCSSVVLSSERWQVVRTVSYRVKHVVYSSQFHCPYRSDRRARAITLAETRRTKMKSAQQGHFAAKHGHHGRSVSF